MSETILLGRGEQIIAIPAVAWRQHLAQTPEHSQERLAFMSPDHHAVRNFVVRQLPRQGSPLPPSDIAAALNLPLARVQSILAELEANLFFLVRDAQGAVAWAYPVTVEKTAHRLRFSTGERLYGA